ncbi:MAG: UvrD-helicase domain-containing protein [Dysgonamonadaceae bacterium]|nr:UvrD-helicase domain-containing protein [Dysgonamonadaceae bacterium]
MDSSKLKIYKASAGSGKTFTLALEYIRELLINHSHHTHRRVLAVTFTKDATGEMKDRILIELYGLAFDCEDSKIFRATLTESLKNSGYPMKDEEITAKSKEVLHAVLHDYSHLHITTIDSFFQKVLRNLARELGRGSRFNLEMNTSKVLSEAVHSVIERAGEDPQLLDWLMAYIEGKLDEGGYWRIDREIMDFSRCIFNEYFQEHEYVLKSQLEGDTLIFKKIKEYHTKVQLECKEYFKNSYAELTAIMSENALEPEDFNRNGVALHFLGKLSAEDFQNVNPDSAVVRNCSEDASKWPSAKTKKKAEVIALAETRFVSLLKTTLDVLRKYYTSRMITQNIHQLGLIWDITNEISRQNVENNRFMLSDTALFLNKMINDSDTSFIYEKIGAEIKHVMIDEFQDTSRLQWKNFRSLLSEILANNYFSMIVGDVKQSIYRWRNGDWGILAGIGEELGVQPLNLAYNYRSEKIIIDFNNQFFTSASETLNEKYSSSFGDASGSPFPDAYPPSDVVQKTKKEAESGFVSIDFISEDRSEETDYNGLVLEKLFEQIKRMPELGIPANKICILTRTNKSIIAIAEHLASQREEYPELTANHYLNIVSDEAFRLGSSPVLRIIIEALRVLIEPHNPVYRSKLDFYLKQYKLNPDPELPETLTRLPLLELVGHLYRFLGLKDIEKQNGYLFTFYDAIGNYLRDAVSDIHAFLKFWDEDLQLKSVSSGTAVDGIRAMTIHKSKGLQFHTVLLPFCDWDIFPEKNPIVWCGAKEGLYDLELLPVKYSRKMFDTVFRDEYRKETVQSWVDNLNLLYVAFTRAEHNLLILSKNKKKLESVDDIRKVSDLLQFLTEKKNGLSDEDPLHYEAGSPDARLKNEEQISENVLKAVPEPIESGFVSEAFNPEKSIFKQSNKSREFINPDLPSKEAYVSHGNIMHTLFSYLKTLEDIPNAVEKLIFEGIILPGEKKEYSRKIRQYIADSQVEDWFSGKYKVYSECTVLTEENGEVTTQRPDRVLFSEEETLIIDYKFGEPRPEHPKQMQRYVRLLEQMNRKNIRTFIWYVEKNKII